MSDQSFSALRRGDEPVPSSVGASMTEPRVDDYARWAFEQAEHIRAGRFDQIDLLNVADEIDDMGKSEFRAFASNLENVLVDMLKWDFQPEKRSRSWALSIEEHRQRISANLEDSPSMAKCWPDAIQRAYRVSRPRAAREARLPIATFPTTCPYGREQIMDAQYAIERS